MHGLSELERLKRMEKEAATTRESEEMKGPGGMLVRKTIENPLLCNCKNDAISFLFFHFKEEIKRVLADVAFYPDVA